VHFAACRGGELDRDSERLPARVGINLRIEDEYLNVHAAGQHSATLKTNVEHHTVAVDDPELLLK
jgi:hypothetical protein